MNRNAPLSVRLLFCLILFFIASCQKINLEDFVHPDKAPKFCNIKTIVAPSFYSPETIIANFSYNKWDDPVSIILNNTHYGQTSFYYRYDKYKRLSEFIKFYNSPPPPGINYESWHRYVWQNNRVIRDTVWNLGFSSDGQNPDNSPEGTGAKAVGYYEYDQQDRIVKTEWYVLVNDLRIWWHTETYQYNSQSNLALHRSDFGFGSVIDTEYSGYDNKINPRRTNKVYMLVDANYSINNPLTATNYNQFRLPLQFSAGVFGKFIFLNSYIDIGNANITYECK
jgi:hypothetical protein